jgi:hypothetical protein
LEGRRVGKQVIPEGTFFKFSDTETTTVKEIPVGLVSSIARFVFDKPFELAPKGQLMLYNAEWWEVVYTRHGREDLFHSGHWKVHRT